MQRTRLVFSGSGGQGVVTAGIFLAEAAVLYEGLIAVQTQTYGAAARGGSARSDVIISTEKINYPKVVQPNILVCLTQEACNRYVGILRPGGLLLTDSHLVRLERKVDAVVRQLPMHQSVMDAVGKSLVLNICVLGALIGLTGLVTAESIVKVMQTRLRPEFLEMNQRALEIGIELVGDV
jgi:2-oxoglutarate ferredoxin oxidoreductase subunit gamma